MARFTAFWTSWPYGPAGWLALLLIKEDDVETNPGPTTLNKQVWICDICHKQIHVRKQISIRCNRIEHWVHLRCAGIRQTQYTDTWTCHLHRESRLTTHTAITPPHPYRPWSRRLPTPHLHILCSHRIGKTQPQSSHPPTTSPPTPPQAKHIHISHTPPTPLIPLTTLIHNTSVALDTIPEPHVSPTSPTLTTTTPHPSPTGALSSTSHPHTLIIHTCNTNNSTRITVTATTSVT